MRAHPLAAPAVHLDLCLSIGHGMAALCAYRPLNSVRRIAVPSVRESPRRAAPRPHLPSTPRSHHRARTGRVSLRTTRSRRRRHRVPVVPEGVPLQTRRFTRPLLAVQWAEEQHRAIVARRVKVRMWHYAAKWSGLDGWRRDASVARTVRWFGLDRWRRYRRDATM